MRVKQNGEVYMHLRLGINNSHSNSVLILYFKLSYKK